MEKLSVQEYKNYIDYMNFVGYKICRCEFKKIIRQIKEDEENEKANEEHNKKLEAMDKDVFFLQSLEKKSFFQELKEKFSLFNFKRDFKKVSFNGKRIYNLIVKK